MSPLPEILFAIPRNPILAGKYSHRFERLGTRTNVRIYLELMTLLHHNFTHPLRPVGLPVALGMASGYVSATNQGSKSKWYTVSPKYLPFP